MKVCAYWVVRLAVVLEILLFTGCGRRDDPRIDIRNKGGQPPNSQKSQVATGPPAPSPGPDYLGDEAKMKRSPRLKLLLATVGRQTRDQITIKAAVVNEGDDAVTWDREFSFFIKWRVQNSDRSYVEIAAMQAFPRLTADESRRRFIPLVPGQTLSKESDITKEVRIFSSARAFGVDGGHSAVGSEETARFMIPISAKRISVEVEYSVINEDKGGFYSLVGRTVEEVGLPTAQYRSNKLEVEIAK
jgi:hypothetical protein